MLPFMFNSGGMRKRSVYVIIALVLIIILSNIRFYFRQLYIEADIANYCGMNEENEIESHVSLFREMFDQTICTIIPVCKVVSLIVDHRLLCVETNIEGVRFLPTKQIHLNGFTRLVLLKPHSHCPGFQSRRCYGVDTWAHRDHTVATPASISLNRDTPC